MDVNAMITLGMLFFALVGIASTVGFIRYSWDRRKRISIYPLGLLLAEWNLHHPPAEQITHVTLPDGRHLVVWVHRDRDAPLEPLTLMQEREQLDHLQRNYPWLKLPVSPNRCPNS